MIRGEGEPSNLVCWYRARLCLSLWSPALTFLFRLLFFCFCFFFSLFHLPYREPFHSCSLWYAVLYVKSRWKCRWVRNRLHEETNVMFHSSYHESPQQKSAKTSENNIFPCEVCRVLTVFHLLTRRHLFLITLSSSRCISKKTTTKKKKPLNLFS